LAITKLLATCLASAGRLPALLNIAVILDSRSEADIFSDIDLFG
jgi:hypothetical protein